MVDSLINLIHLLATAVWLGGAIFIKIIHEPATRLIDPREAGKLQSNIAKRFSIAAWISILLLCITGYLKTPSGMLFDTSSETGITLMVKHVLILFVIVVALVITFVAVPRLRRSAPAPGSQPSEDFLRANRQIQRLSMTSTIAGVVILVCASFLW